MRVRDYVEYEWGCGEGVVVGRMMWKCVGLMKWSSARRLGTMHFFLTQKKAPKGT